MARPLVIIAALFIGGLLLGQMLPPLGGWAALAMLATLLGTGVWAFRRREIDAGSRMLLLAVVPLGLWQGARVEREWQTSQALLAPLGEGAVVEVAGTIAREPRETRHGVILTLDPAVIIGRDDRVRLSPLPVMVHLIRRAGVLLPVESVAIGDALRGEGHLIRDPPRRNPGGFERQHWHRHGGMAATVMVSLPEAVEIAAGDPSAWARGLRALRHARVWIAGTLERQQGLRAGAFSRAILLGDRAALAPSTEHAFLVTGLGHLFAVSGLHTGLVFALVFGLLRILRVPRRASLALALLALLPFMALVGFKVSVVRATVLIAAVVGGRLIERNVSALSGLALAAFVICLLDPRAPLQPGFIMSFLAVLTLVLHAPLARDLMGSDDPQRVGHPRLRRWGAGLLLLVALQLAMVPTMAAHFGLVSWMTVPMNTVLTVVSFGLMAGSLSGVALAALWPWAGEALGWATGQVTLATLDAVEWVAGWPGVAPSVTPLPWWLVGLWYLLLLGGPAVLRAHGRDLVLKRRARWAVAWAGLAAILVWLPLLGGPGGWMRITFLDVGQGDATIVETPRGQVLVIDGGRLHPHDAGRDIVDPALRARGITQIDWIIASHVDADHIGGLIHLLRHFPVRHVGEGDRRGRTLTLDAFHTAVIESGARRERLTRGVTLREGDLAIRVLHPDPDPERRAAVDSNQRSVVLSLELDEAQILIMGDAEMSAERRILAFEPVLDTDVLRTGHHGSRHGSGAPFLAEVTPLIAVISCGRDNPYAHPHPDMLARLSEVDALTLRTDLVGAVTVETDGRTIVVRTGG